LLLQNGRCPTTVGLALLAAGADRTAKNKDGKTAFDVVCLFHKDKFTNIVEAFDFYAAHNTPYFVFVFVLCAARRRPPRPAEESASQRVAVGVPACVLQQLNSHGPHFAVGLKRRIAEFAGVPMRATPSAVHFKAIVTAP